MKKAKRKTAEKFIPKVNDVSPDDLIRAVMQIPAGKKKTGKKAA